MKRRILTTIAISLMVLAPVSAAAFSWREFFGGAADDFEDEAAEGVTIENDVSVSASTGGNSASGGSSASGTDGSSGGTVQTGEANVRAIIQTSAGDDDFEDIQIEVETKGEPAVIEKHIATSSGKVKVQTNVRVEVGATSSGSAAETRRESEDDEPAKNSKANSASNDERDGEDTAEQTNEGDVFEDEDDEDEEMGTTTRADMSELSERNQERLRGLFRRLFSRLFSFFGR